MNGQQLSNDFNDLPYTQESHVDLPCPDQTQQWSRCSNFVQNPSFEVGLTGWVTNNVSIADNNPFEGTQVARLDTGISSIFQDISLSNVLQAPLLLSFTLTGGEDDETDVPNLVAEVIWLDEERNYIANGLRLLIPDSLIGRNARLSYLELTDRPPAAAVWARLQFSKAPGQPGEDIVELDQIVLTPVSSGNLVVNHGFEIALAGWTTNNFTSNYQNPFEGTAQATALQNATLYQDVKIQANPPHSYYMLAFGANVDQTSTLAAQVQWIDKNGNIIGKPGLEINIPSNNSGFQNNYSTYVDMTRPAPKGAVKARILFTANVGTSSFVRIDQVILARVASSNLVQNPGFEADLMNWKHFNTTAKASIQAFEGGKVASIAEGGGSLYQDVSIPSATGHCFLLNFSLRYSQGTATTFSGNVFVKVLWLDNNGREIGLGLSLLIPRSTPRERPWLVYTGVTEPAPPCTVEVRVQFSKSSSTGGSIEIDNVVLGRLV